MRWVGWLLVASALSACAGRGNVAAGTSSAVSPVEVAIIGFNDFHGNLEPPNSFVPAVGPDGAEVKVPAGGAAFFASAIATLKAQNPNHLVLSAGDLISASPITSSQFLDEPTIHAMNRIGIDYDAVGNHELDRGQRELLRIQNGGCEKNTRIEPCRLEPYTGARFGILAANIVKADGSPLFPAYGMRTFGSGAAQVKVAVIGLTLRTAPTLVMESGIEGLTFRDEADTVNALIPRLKAEGADAVVLLIHQGGYTTVGYNDKSCAGLTGDILEILDRLSPAVDLVVSGHTHRSYVCDYGKVNATKPFLLTSAGTQGTTLTDIRLSIDPVAHRVVAKRADNLIVQSDGFTNAKGAVPNTNLFPRYAADPGVAAIVTRYAAAAAPLKNRVVGRLTAPASKGVNSRSETVLADLIADAQLAGMRAAGFNADLALMNYGGARVDLVPGEDGAITFGQIYAAQPFGNVAVVRSYTGAQLRAVLEQQFRGDDISILSPSANVRYGFDTSRPAGQRIIDLRIDGRPLDETRMYRVVVSNFLANGGDEFSSLAAGTDEVIGPVDLDLLEAYLSHGQPVTPPTPDRVRNLSPKN